jgi:hypothetical protein
MMTRNELAYFWIGKAVDVWVDFPLAPELRPPHLFFYHMRQKLARRTRMTASRVRARARAGGQRFALPDMRALMAAPEGTSHHAASCGTGASWSAHHAKGVDSRRSPDTEGYQARIDQSVPVPRAGPLRGRVLPTRHEEPGSGFEAARAALAEEQEAEVYLARLMREDVPKSFMGMKKYARFS